MTGHEFRVVPFVLVPVVGISFVEKPVIWELLKPELSSYGFADDAISYQQRGLRFLRDTIRELLELRVFMRLRINRDL